MCQVWIPITNLHHSNGKYIFSATMGYENTFSDDGDDSGEQYFEGYADLKVHRLMLSDKPRMHFYRTCITDFMRENKNQVVVDVGSGSGLLSCWAALAGAAHVFSIEPSAVAALQHAVFCENNVQKMVTILATNVEKVIEDGVDAFISGNPVVSKIGGVRLIVSEWMGFYLFHEGMLPSVLRARDFFSAVNHALGDRVVLDLIPNNATLYAAPVSLRPYYEAQFKQFWSCVEGVKMQALGEADYETTLEAASPLVESMHGSALLHEGQAFWTASLLTVSVTECVSITSTCRFCFDHSTAANVTLRDVGKIVVDGFCIWFDVEYGPNRLCTSPLSDNTHWKQVTVVLPAHVRHSELVSLQSDDDPLELEIQLHARDEQQRCYTIDIELK